MSERPAGPPADDLDAALAAEAGVHRLALATPFRVGRVNAYLIEDEPLTLVDTGPNSGETLDELERALAALGHSVADIQLLVITHQHIDHFGLAEIVRRRSQATVAALDGLAPRLAGFDADAEHEDAFAERVMLRHGVPVEVVTALRAVSASFRGWGASVQVGRTLNDGEQLQLRDRTLTVLHRPGHSPSDTVLYDRDRRLLIAGDHLLERISSNAIVARPLDAPPHYDGPRPKPLLTYTDSLKRTREMDILTVLPGHGAPFGGHVALIDERFRMQARRAEKIRTLIVKAPKSAFEIAQALWGNVAVTQAYLTISEVLGHVDLLLQSGAVSESEQDGVAQFQAHG